MKVLAPTPYLKSSQSPLQRHHALRRDSGAELPHPRLPRPTASPTALHSRSARATRPIPGASFIVNGATLAQNSALGSVGGELRFANGIMLLAKFDGEFASHSSTYGGTGTLRYRW